MDVSDFENEFVALGELFASMMSQQYRDVKQSKNNAVDVIGAIVLVSNGTQQRPNRRLEYNVFNDHVDVYVWFIFQQPASVSFQLD